MPEEETCPHSSEIKNGELASPKKENVLGEDASLQG